MAEVAWMDQDIGTGNRNRSFCCGQSLIASSLEYNIAPSKIVRAGVFLDKSIFVAADVSQDGLAVRGGKPCLLYTSDAADE